jgi:uncharacterized protein (TIGR03435 family)
MYNVSMRVLLRAAYKLDDSQKISGADWIDNEFFDVVAKLPDGARQDQAPEMLRALLAERCKLVAHWESREEKAYTLSVGNDGPKLKAAAPNASANSTWPRDGGGRTFIGGGQTPHGWIAYFRLNGHYVIEGSGIAVADILPLLRREVDGPIVDMTGLKGLYDLSLPVPGLWLRNRSMAKSWGDDAEPSDPAEVDLFKSFENLGLKLEKRAVPIKQVAIDHAEKVPIGN